MSFAVAAMMRATPPEGKEFAMKKNTQTTPAPQVETPSLKNLVVSGATAVRTGVKAGRGRAAY
jgi:hypothetical protein